MKLIIVIYERNILELSPKTMMLLRMVRPLALFQINGERCAFSITAAAVALITGITTKTTKLLVDGAS